MRRRPLTALPALPLLALVLALVASCRTAPGERAPEGSSDRGTATSDSAPPPPAPDAAAVVADASGASVAGSARPPELDPRTEALLIEYRIREIEDLLAADAISPSVLDPSGIWRIDDFVFMAFRTGESAWTFTLLPTEPDLRMPPGNAPDWFRVTAAAGERFAGRIQADVDVWLEADGELAAGGRSFRVACREKDGTVAFDVVLDRGLGIETRGGLEAAIAWLTNRLRDLNERELEHERRKNSSNR